MDVVILYEEGKLIHIAINAIRFYSSTGSKEIVPLRKGILSKEFLDEVEIEAALGMLPLEICPTCMRKVRAKI